MNMQVDLNFEQGLTQRFTSLMEVVRSDVEYCGRLKKIIAADMNMSPPEFSRILADNPNDPRNFTLDMLPSFIRATGRKTTIYWLIETFLADPDKRRERALETLADMLPTIAALVKDAKAPEAKPLKAVG